MPSASSSPAPQPFLARVAENLLAHHNRSLAMGFDGTGDVLAECALLVAEVRQLVDALDQRRDDAKAAAATLVRDRLARIGALERRHVEQSERINRPSRGASR